MVRSCPRLVRVDSSTLEYPLPKFLDVARVGKIISVANKRLDFFWFYSRSCEPFGVRAIPVHGFLEGIFVW